MKYGNYSLSGGLPTAIVIYILSLLFYLFWSNKHFCLPVCLSDICCMGFPEKFQTIYFIIYREIAFWVKSLKSELYQNGRLENISNVLP